MFVVQVVLGGKVVRHQSNATLFTGSNINLCVTECIQRSLVLLC